MNDVMAAAVELVCGLDGTLFKTWLQVADDLDELAAEDIPAEVNAGALAKLVRGLAECGELPLPG